MLFVYLSSKHSEQQTLFKNAILCVKDLISDYLHLHKKAIKHNTPCQEGMLLVGKGGEGVVQIFGIVVTMTITPGKFPCTMQNNEKKCRKKEFDTLQKTRIWTSHLLTK